MEKKVKSLQSAKIWHEGDNWYVIASVGIPGEESEKQKYGPFDSNEKAIDKVKSLCK